MAYLFLHQILIRQSPSIVGSSYYVSCVYLEVTVHVYGKFITDYYYVKHSYFTLWAKRVISHYDASNTELV